MLSYTISNKLTRGKNQTVPQNLDNPKNGWTFELPTLENTQLSV